MPQVVWRGRVVDDDVEAERPAGPGPRLHDPFSHGFYRHAAATEHTEAAGMGDRRSELWAGRRAYAGIQDRIADPEQIANRSAQAGRHWLIIPQHVGARPLI